DGFFPAAFAAGALTGDGEPELVVANAGYGAGRGHPFPDPGSVSVLLGTGDGTFQAPLTFGAGLHPQSVAVADFNGDGKLDLAVTSLESPLCCVQLIGRVSVFLGNGDGTFQAALTFTAGYRPVSVVVGDFNGDRVPDLAVAN